MSIENAAREIAGCYYDGNSNCQKDIAEIIRRHLFPSVKPEEVAWNEMYYVRACQSKNWLVLKGKFIVGDDEIRGPIPMPE